MKKITLLLFLTCAVSAFSQSNCQTAQLVSIGTYTVNAIDGSEAPSPICPPNSNTATSGKWYKYNATTNNSITVSTDLAVNTGKDTRVHIYKGLCGSLECVGGDDDSGTGYLSVATINGTPGTTYYIAFDNRWSPVGFDFKITEQAPVVPPPTLVSFSPVSASLAGSSYKNCVVDMNGDYLDDIVGVSGSQIKILYQNATGGFTTATYPTTMVNNVPSWSIAAADYDKNGYNDLIYGGGSGATFMKANSNGTAYTATSYPNYIFCQRTNFVDINNDGNLDAFVCHDVDPNVYFLNDGNNNFTFHQGGMGDHPEGGNYGSIWVDYDNDGDPDLFIAKCRGGNTTANINELHRNDGNGVFTNVSVQAGLADPIQTWSSAWADFDNDGDMDVLVGASSNANGMHKLMRNNGDGTFTDVTAGSGYPQLTNLGQENVAHDFNNDGFVDVFGAGNIIMINNGNMTFTPQPIGVTNGPIGDLNNDGFLDIQNNDNVYMNNGNSNKWLKILLKGVQSNINGIGARIEIFGPWGKQIRDVRSGDGFRNMSSLNVHFGLGTATEIYQVIVKWPSGTVDVINNPAVNQSLMVVEGTALNNPEVALDTFMIYPNPAQDFVKVHFNNLDSSAKKALFYDTTGRLVLKAAIQSEQIDIRTLSKGTYILNIESTNGQKYSTKFIKN